MYCRTGRHFVLVLLCFAASPMIHAEEVVPSTYRRIAAEHGIPGALFYAIALAESGKTISSLHQRHPWPWTLNIAGEGVYFKTRQEAWYALDQSLRAGETSIDIGLMQVNWRFHHERLGSSWLALEPHHNLTVGAKILENCYENHRDWWPVSVVTTHPQIAFVLEGIENVWLRIGAT